METNLSTGMILAAGSNSALVTFALYTLAVFGIAWLSNRLLKSKSFMSEYFLGSRSLGVWAFALTFAATSSSGGSFTGFPSKIYTHGWILALWIGSYMVVPICTMGLIGKRLNQVARISGAITVPDVIRDRFQSKYFGLLAVSLIVFFMSFNLVAQFKAGSLILQTLLTDVDVFHTVSSSLFGSLTSSTGDSLAASLFGGVNPGYLLCLFTFGVAVIIYTTYGGFHAVVWTDVMQGVVMVVGVLIMLPLALYQVGKLAPPGSSGLEYATREMAKMTPPQKGTATLNLAEARGQDLKLRSDTWIPFGGEGDEQRLLRLTNRVTIVAGQTEAPNIDVLELTTRSDIERKMAALKPSEVVAGLSVENVITEPYAYGSKSDQAGAYVSGPGPSETDMNGFLPASLAISFFFMWAISGSGQPSNMVRLMAFKDARTLRLSIFTVAIYYTAIYFPLVIIFCCARLLIPGMEAESDRIMPAMAVFLSENAGVAWLAGLLVAAPFAAVMSTVDSFLLMISSALVRDIYQRNINPAAKEKAIKRLCYFFTVIVGTAAMIGAINPPQFLQDIIVYVGSGLAASFLAPIVYALYWPRANSQGCMAGMLAGFAAHLSLYIGGIFANDSFFRPYRIMNFDPIIFGLLVSFATVYVVSNMTPAPPADLVKKYFYKKTKKTTTS
jgi:Na+/pantothenate symporter